MNYEDKSAYEEGEDGFYEYEYAAENHSEEETENIALTVLGAYDGQRNSQNERHGFGKTILPNGDAYVGTYKNGLRHGYGQYKFKEGGMYQGCYKHGLRNGKGVMNYPDMSKYEGYWTNNKKDGDGVHTFENHDQFTGTWKNDMKHGLGTYTYCKTGTILKGYWKNNVKVGNFQMFFPTSVSSGFTFHGTWDKNESIFGEGFYVFDNLALMQRGAHVLNSMIPEHLKSRDVPHKSNTIWYSYEILPIINSMLPHPPIARPTFTKRQSCDLGGIVMSTTSTENIPTSPSRLGSYEYKDDLWNEMELVELVPEEGLNELEYEDNFGVKSSRIYQSQKANF